MKVLYVLHATFMGGATLSFLSLVRGLMGRGVRPVIVAPCHDEQLEAIFRDMGITCYVIPMALHCYVRYRGLASLKFPYRMLRRGLTWHRSIKALERIVRQEQPDIIHTNVGPVHIGHVVAHRMGIPHVWHIREYGDLDFDMHAFPSVRAYRKCLSTDHVICITKDLVRYNHLVNNPHACTIYNGVRGRKDVFYDGGKEPYFLCASRIEETKGHEDVLHAFARFHERHPDWRLVILGAGADTYLAKLRDMVKGYRLDGAVSFEGHKRNVTDYMRRARALVVASHFEGFGRMTAEASFAGCMVIGRATGGTLEILQQTGGLLFNDNEALLSSMEEAACMPDDLYRNRVLHAQRRAQELFSEEAYVENVYNVYSTIKGPHPPAP